MSEDNKAVAQRFYDEVINGRNLDVVDELLTDDFVEHEALPGGRTDREAPREFFGMLHQAVPDLQVEIHEIVAEGNRVVVRSTARGTHEGELMGVPGTGRTFEMAWADFMEVRDGKCSAHWGVADMSGLMQPAESPA
jgi:steroid delta-isomerase-like uncharacterized protein